MKNQLIKSWSLILVFILAGGFGLVRAQEWNPAQKEVWKNVNDYWALMTKGDLNGFLDYFHQDYVGWDDNSPLPSTKEDVKKWMGYYFNGAKVPAYEIKPLAIKVYGDFAFVHYYYSMVIEKEGKSETESGRWTDILMKQGTKWVLIGDNGGKTSKEKD